MWWQNRQIGEGSCDQSNDQCKPMKCVPCHHFFCTGNQNCPDNIPFLLLCFYSKTPNWSWLGICWKIYSINRRHIRQQMTDRTISMTFQDIKTSMWLSSCADHDCFPVDVWFSVSWSTWIVRFRWNISRVEPPYPDMHRQTPSTR